MINVLHIFANYKTAIDLFSSLIGIVSTFFLIINWGTITIIAVNLFILFFWWIPRIRKMINDHHHGELRLYLKSLLTKPSDAFLEQDAYRKLGGYPEQISWYTIKTFKIEGRKKAFEGVDWQLLINEENYVKMRVWVEPKKGFISHYHDVLETIEVEKGILTLNKFIYIKGEKVEIPAKTVHAPFNNEDDELILIVEFKRSNFF